MAMAMANERTCLRLESTRREERPTARKGRDRWFSASHANSWLNPENLSAMCHASVKRHGTRKWPRTVAGPAYLCTTMSINNGSYLEDINTMARPWIWPSNGALTSNVHRDMGYLPYRPDRNVSMRNADLCRRCKYRVEPVCLCQGSPLNGYEPDLAIKPPWDRLIIRIAQSCLWDNVIDARLLWSFCSDNGAIMELPRVMELRFRAILPRIEDLVKLFCRFSEIEDNRSLEVSLFRCLATQLDRLIPKWCSIVSSER